MTQENRGAEFLVNISVAEAMRALKPRGLCLVASRGRLANRRAQDDAVGALTTRAYWLLLPRGVYAPIELVAPRDDHPEGMPELGSAALPWQWFNNVGYEAYLRSTPGEYTLLAAEAIDVVREMDRNPLFGWPFEASKVTIHRKPETPALSTLILVRRL